MDEGQEGQVSLIGFVERVVYGRIGTRLVKINVEEFIGWDVIGRLKPEAVVQDWNGQDPAPGPGNQAPEGAIPAPVVKAEVFPERLPGEVEEMLQAVIGSPYRALGGSRDRGGAKRNRGKGRSKNEKLLEALRAKKKRPKEKMKQPDTLKKKMERKQRAEKRNELKKQAENEDDGGGCTRELPPIPVTPAELARRRYISALGNAKIAAKKVFRGRK